MTWRTTWRGAEKKGVRNLFLKNAETPHFPHIREKGS